MCGMTLHPADTLSGLDCTRRIVEGLHGPPEQVSLRFGLNSFADSLWFSSLVFSVHMSRFGLLLNLVCAVPRLFESDDRF